MGEFLSALPCGHQRLKTGCEKVWGATPARHIADMATTFLPFLYRTRTLQSLPRNSVTPRFLRSLLHTTARGRARDHIPFELPPDISSELLPDKPEDSSNKATITPSERLIFDRIFEEIASRGPLSGHGTSKPRPGVRERRDTPPLKSAHMPSGRDSINILSSTAKEITGHPRPTAGLDSLHPLGSISTAKNPQEALLRFPPSLRRAAQLALGIIEPSGQEQERLGDLGGKDTGDPGSASATNADDNSVTEQNRNRTQHSQEESHGRTVDEEALGRQLEWESLRREFQQEIEARMDQCESDTALWDVLETEVFLSSANLALGRTRELSRVGGRGLASWRLAPLKRASTCTSTGHVTLHFFSMPSAGLTAHPPIPRRWPWLCFLASRTLVLDLTSSA